jgi:hypothetical protein
VWVAYWDHVTHDQDVVVGKVRAVSSDTNGRRWSKPQTIGTKSTSDSIDARVLGNRVNVAADPVPGSTRAVIAWATADTTGAYAAVQLASTESTVWSASHSVSDPAVVITRQPAVAFGADGMLALGYYDQVGSTISYNLGQEAWPGARPFTFHQVASEPSHQDITFDTAPLAPRLGDYTSVAEADGTALAAWSDDRVGDQMQVWFGR